MDSPNSSEDQARSSPSRTNTTGTAAQSLSSSNATSHLGTTPPFWSHHRYQRAASNASSTSSMPLTRRRSPILLEDHTLSSAAHRKSAFSSWVRKSENSRAKQYEISEDEAHASNAALWAKSVKVDGYVVVSNESMTTTNSVIPNGIGLGGIGAGSYVVWHVTVTTLEGGDLKIRKRYSEFDHLRKCLEQTFPHSASALPPLPPKSVICESSGFPFC